MSLKQNGPELVFLALIGFALVALVLIFLVTIRGNGDSERKTKEWSEEQIREIIRDEYRRLEKLPAEKVKNRESISWRISFSDFSR